MFDEVTNLARLKFDRWFWLAVLVAALVVVPRSILITSAHSPTMDEQTHLRIGLSNLLGNPSGMINNANDAPLGQEISALPMLVVGCNPAKPMNRATAGPHTLASDDLHAQSHPPPALATRLRAARRDVLFGNRLGPDALQMLIAIWKAILFVPAAGLIFHWCRWLYGLAAAWMGMALVLIDPTFAAHISLATIDVIAVEGILFACYFAWRWMEQPSSKGLLVSTAIFSAAALLMKLTTIILPGVILLIGLAHWIHRDRKWPLLRQRLNWLFAGGLLTLFFIWALTGFDISTPGQWLAISSHPGKFSLYPALQYPWPAGHFVQVLLNGFEINASDRWAYLFGHSKPGGWWYYFPAVAMYKIPLGFFMVFVLAILSFWWRGFAFEEWSIFIPMLAWAGMLMFFTHINTGFRHFLPVMVFVYMAAARCFARLDRARRGPPLNKSAVVLALGWAGAIMGFAHTLTYHPDYLSYFNRPLATPWLICNDSNIDWGQGLKETGQWLNEHPTGNRPVYLRYDWDPVWADYYLDHRVQRVTQFQSPPKHGLLIICPVWVAGYWDPMDGYGFLRQYRPMDIIGHSMLVYDLDHLSE